MALLSYKHQRILQDDAGLITELLMRVYDGAITTEQEEDATGQVRPVTRYRRTRLLGERAYAPQAVLADPVLRASLNTDLVALAVASGRATVELAQVDVRNAVPLTPTRDTVDLGGIT
jgi:hypothetical protein